MKNYTELLKEEIVFLKASVDTLLKSWTKCQKIELEGELEFEEMESIDSLTSKFGRTSDIFTQKVIRTIFALEREPINSFVDIMNRAEKLGIIISAENMIYIRDLRNQIAHEYIPEVIQELVPEVLEYTTKLIENIDQTFNYIITNEVGS